MNIKLSDEESGYLYGMLFQRVTESRFRRRRSPRSEAERAALRIAQSIKRKLRIGMARGAARTIETLALSVF